MGDREDRRNGDILKVFKTTLESAEKPDLISRTHNRHAYGWTGFDRITYGIIPAVDAEALEVLAASRNPVAITSRSVMRYGPKASETAYHIHHAAGVTVPYNTVVTLVAVDHDSVNTQQRYLDLLYYPPFQVQDNFDEFMKVYNYLKEHGLGELYDKTVDVPTKASEKKQ